MGNTMNDASTEKDELEKIMSEIEELQHEMEVTPPAALMTTALTKATTAATAQSTDSPYSLGDSIAEPKAEPTVFPVLESTPSGAFASEITEMLTEASEEDILKEIQASAQIDDSDMEATLSQLKGDDSVNGLLDAAVDSALDRAITTTAEAEFENDTEIETAVAAAEGTSFEGGLDEAEEMSMSNNTGGNSDGSLTMTLTGNMTLKLKYEFEGQEVTVSFADQALSVKMTDGTEFKVPVSRLAATSTGTASNVKAFKKTG
jgi:hypothetical protein